MTISVLASSILEMAEEGTEKSLRFRPPRSGKEEISLLERSKPRSTQYKDKWSVDVFQNWQATREKKFPLLDPGSLFKDYDIQHVQSLEERLEDLDSLSLNYWLTKFVQEVANKKGGRYPPRTLYGLVCGLKRHLEDENKGNALNPLDSSDKRYFLGSCAFVKCAFILFRVVVKVTRYIF